jgi:hypothetical protein
VEPGALRAAYPTARDRVVVLHGLVETEDAWPLAGLAAPRSQLGWTGKRG